MRILISKGYFRYSKLKKMLLMSFPIDIYMLFNWNKFIPVEKAT